MYEYNSRLQLTRLATGCIAVRTCRCVRVSGSSRSDAALISRRDALLLLAAAPAAAVDFASRWPSGSDQVWLGPEYWANRLQDWRLQDGRIECIAAGGDRNVVLLTHELSVRPEPFEISVDSGRLD